MRRRWGCSGPWATAGARRHPPGRGNMFCLEGRLQAGWECYAAALELYRGTGARLGEANTLKSQGDFCIFLSQPCRSRHFYRNSLDFLWSISAAFRPVAGPAAAWPVEVDATDQGLALLQQAKALFSPSAMAKEPAALRLAWRTGRYVGAHDEAVTYLSQAIRYCREMERPWLRSWRRSLRN